MNIYKALLVLSVGIIISCLTVSCIQKRKNLNLLYPNRSPSALVIYSIVIEDQPDGSGTEIVPQTLNIGDTATMYAVSRTASGDFVGLVNANWSLSNANIGSLSNNTGTFSVFSSGTRSGSVTINSTQSGYVTDTLDFTVLPDAASDVFIENADDGSGSEINTRVIDSGETSTFYAVTRDSYGNFTGLDSVDWTISVPIGTLSVATGASTVLTGTLTGTAVITADHATLTDDDTGMITVIGDEAIFDNAETWAIYPDKFTLYAGVIGDLNGDGTYTAYICNETDAPGCNPIAGATMAMVNEGEWYGQYKHRAYFDTLPAGYDPGDEINYTVIVSDADGVTSPTHTGTLALPNPTHLYRSVGPGNTSPLMRGANVITLSIAGSTATFSHDVPDKVGVGDVIQYDSDNNGSIDAIAFIHERTSSKVYTVKDKDGNVPTATAADDKDWSILRAYISLNNAIRTKTENTGIEAGLRDFDPSFIDLTSSTGDDLIIHLACYADATDTTTFWTGSGDYHTDAGNYIHVFAPKDKHHVGVSQRHNGVWDTSKYHLSISNQWYAIRLDEANIRFEGVQVDNTNSGSGISFLGNGDNRVIDSIIRRTDMSYRGAGVSFAGAWDYRYTTAIIKNNIISGWNTGVLKNWPAAQGLVSNNTLYDNRNGVNVSGSFRPGTIELHNNIVYSATSSGTAYGGAAYLPSTNHSNNISNDDTSPDAAFRNKTVVFKDAGNGDYRLDISDTEAIDMGVDLSGNAFLPYTNDVVDNVRSGTWDIGAYEIYRDTTASLISILEYTDTSFHSFVDYTGDEDEDSTAVLWYCNDTDNGGCDPLTGTSTAMLRDDERNRFYKNVEGLVAPNDPSDTLNLKVVISDPDGTPFTLTATQAVTLEPVKILYRSVGPGNTTSLADSGGTNNFNIVGSNTASFDTGLPDNIGVGDVIQYDSDGNSSIDAIAFISSRTSSTSYTVLNSVADNPVATVAPTTDWAVYRAYSGMSGIFYISPGNENTGIDINVRDFELFSGKGLDLTGIKRKLYVAFYNDAVETTGGMILSNYGWKTSKNYDIKLFAPSSITEVGVSQRHSGVYSTSGFRIENTNDWWPPLFIQGVGHISVEGMQFKNSQTKFNSYNLFVGFNGMYSREAQIIIKDNISGSHTQGNGIRLSPGGDIGKEVDRQFYLVNNIIYGSSDDGVRVLPSNNNVASYYFYNNTIYGNASCGIRDGGGSVLNRIYYNNISYNNTGDDYCGGATAPTASSNNISSDGTSPDAGFRSVTVAFQDAPGEDFSLGGGDTGALNQGADLSSDPYYPFNTDITGAARGAPWSIGAFE